MNNLLFKYLTDENNFSSLVPDETDWVSEYLLSEDEFYDQHHAPVNTPLTPVQNSLEEQTAENLETNVPEMDTIKSRADEPLEDLEKENSPRMAIQPIVPTTSQDFPNSTSSDELLNHDSRLDDYHRRCTSRVFDLTKSKIYQRRRSLPIYLDGRNRKAVAAGPIAGHYRPVNAQAQPSTPAYTWQPARDISSGTLESQHSYSNTEAQDTKFDKLLHWDFYDESLENNNLQLNYTDQLNALNNSMYNVYHPLEEQTSYPPLDPERSQIVQQSSFETAVPTDSNFTIQIQENRNVVDAFNAFRPLKRAYSPEISNGVPVYQYNSEYYDLIFKDFERPIKKHKVSGEYKPY